MKISLLRCTGPSPSLTLSKIAVIAAMISSDERERVRKQKRFKILKRGGDCQFERSHAGAVARTRRFPRLLRFVKVKHNPRLRGLRTIDTRHDSTQAPRTNTPKRTCTGDCWTLEVPRRKFLQSKSQGSPGIVGLRRLGARDPSICW